MMTTLMAGAALSCEALLLSHRYLRASPSLA
jgi:hypothetical protein